MANVMSLKNLKNKVHRDGFDLSRKNLFTAKVGALYPVFCQEVIPGDKFNINVQSFTRTQPINTAAYTRIREYVDFFFVPYHLLWNKFDDFITQVSQPQQAASIDTPVATAWPTSPYFNSQEVEYMIHSMFLHETRSNSTKKGLDTFGYCASQNWVQLLNYLGYGDFSYTQSLDYDGTNRPALALSPWRLLAYQKIYHDFYRDSQWENAKPNIYNVDYINTRSNTKIPIMNLPFHDMQAPGVSPDVDIDSMFSLRYANYNKDYFLGVLPNAQYGSESFAPINLTVPSVVTNKNDQYKINLVLAEFDNPIISGGQLKDVDGGQSDVAYHTHRTPTQDISTGLSILALRQAQCLQKWKEIANSGSRDYQEQIEKHWGVKPSSERSHKCKYLGGQSSTIDISEVVNTNLTSGNNADIQGKGIGSNNQFIEFDNGNGSADYGVILGIYHAAPLLDYEAIGIEPHNTKVTPTSFAIPEFDQIGMQTQTSEQLAGIPALVNGAPVSYGYVPRYAEYKTAVDMFRGGFSKSFKNWVVGLDVNEILSRFNGGNIPWSFSYLSLKIDPKVMNNIFVAQIVPNDPTNNLGYDNEQLLINMQANVSAVRNLDYNGLPY